MRKKLYRFLKLMFFTNIGVFLGRALYEVNWYRNHPEIYAMNSAPWYTNILVYGITALAAAVILGIVLTVLKRILDKEK